MKILGRLPKRLIALLWSFPGYLVASIRCMVLFREPIGLLCCYIRRQPPKHNQVHLRNGIVLHLSRDHSDIVTVFLIFCRRDYGYIKAGTSVVDVGANIGVYSIYAAMNGASTVHAYEPCEESFDLLRRNIACNGFAQIVTPHKAVVVGKPSSPVMFPRTSSVFNRIEFGGRESSSNSSLVSAVPFSEVTKSLRVSSLVKMDCEGGEYDIILNSESSAFECVDEVRLEWHLGPKDQLFLALEKHGFHVTFMGSGRDSDVAWCSRGKRA